MRTLTIALILLGGRAAAELSQKPASTPARPTLEEKRAASLPGARLSPPPGESGTRPRPERDGAPSLVAPAALGPSIPFDRMHYDRPGDGALWALGTAYKVRFGPNAVTVIPRLGSASPELRPIDLRLASVTVGDRPLAFEPKGGAEREGDVVRYARGSFTEFYRLAPGSLEQLFRFDARVGPLRDARPSEDLVLSIEVATELEAVPAAEARAPGALEWRSAHGGVRYGRATALDARGATCAAPTALEGGMLEIRVPADFLATARYPLTIDPVISTFDVDTSPEFDLYPDLAYDLETGRWAIVWARHFGGGDWDVWCETRDAGGSYIEGAFVDMTSERWLYPRIANNLAATQFLVVAEVGLDPDRVVMGRTREAETTAMGPQFLISGTVANAIRPDVGGDSRPLGFTNYCVAWEGIWDAEDHDIYARLVRNDGTLPGGIFLLEWTTQDHRNPAVSNSAGTALSSERLWTIVWDHELSPDDHDILGAQLRTTGTLTLPLFAIDLSSADDRYPTVTSILDGASGDRPYLVAYQRDQGDHLDIQGRAMRGSAAATSSTNLSQLMASATVLRNQTFPCVDADGSTFLVAYSQTELASTNRDVIVGTLTLADTELLLAEPTAYWGGDTGADETAVAICSQRSGGGPPGEAMGVWSSGTDIEGGRYASPGPGDVYCTSLPHSGGETARLSASGSTSIAINELDLAVTDGPPFQSGLFFIGSQQMDLPYGEGRLCAGGSVHRIHPVVALDGAGSVVRSLEFTQPYGAGVFAGPPGVNFQFWFRDPAGGPAGFNFSDALHVEFQP